MSFSCCRSSARNCDFGIVRSLRISEYRVGDKAITAGRWTGVGGNAATGTEMECQIASTVGQTPPQRRARDSDLDGIPNRVDSAPNHLSRGVGRDRGDVPNRLDSAPNDPRRGDCDRDGVPNRGDSRPNDLRCN